MRESCDYSRYWPELLITAGAVYVTALNLLLT